MSFHASHFRYFLPCSTSSIGQLTCFAMTLLNFERRRITPARITHLSYILCPRLKIQCWKSYWPTTNTLTKNNQQVVLKTNERIPDYPSPLLCTLTPTYRIHLLTKTDNETLIPLHPSLPVSISCFCPAGVQLIFFQVSDMEVKVREA